MDLYMNSKTKSKEGNMKYSIILTTAIVSTLLITGCQPTLVGTWDSVEITNRKKQDSPTATSIRMVMTQANDSFLILDNDNGSRDIWHSVYRTEDDQLFVQYLIDQPDIFRFRFTDGNLVVENDEIKVVFKRVK